MEIKTQGEYFLNSEYLGDTKYTPTEDDNCLFDRLEAEEVNFNNVFKLSKILIVGAGGIGCELLKDLVLEGFINLEIIDLDTIDVSNLNRQFLFHRCHVKKPKAIVARESALNFNPKANITAHHDSIFNTQFGVGYFKTFKLVVNALDNRAARNHVNRMCLASGVPLIDSGTAGYHGQVEMVCKGVTQCYECEPKPTQKSYPGCTIRNTPSEPVHCIVWAKHLFNQLFGEEDADNEVSPDSADPELVAIAKQKKSDENKSITSTSETEKADSPETGKEDKQENNATESGNVDNVGDNAETAGSDDLVSNAGNVARVSTREWARMIKYNPEQLFQKFFVEDIKYLLSMEALWKTRKAPTPSSVDFTSLTAEHAKQLVALDRVMKIWNETMCAQVFAESCQVLRERMEKLPEGDYLTWDKDDDVALDFVTACANTRSLIFGIAVLSRFDLQAIAGNIIPAIATTNAIIGGIVINRIRNILQDNIGKNTTVHLRKYPNPNDELFLPEKQLIPPNPKCYVCAPQPQVTVELDVMKMTLQIFEQQVLKDGLNVIAPDVSNTMKSQIILSSEEGETDENNSKTLKELGITDGCILEVDDFMQEYQLTLIIRHKERAYNDPPFSLVDAHNLKKDKSESEADTSQVVEPDSTDEPVKQKRKMETDEIPGPSGVSQSKSGDESDNDCVVTEDCEDIAVDQGTEDDQLMVIDSTEVDKESHKGSSDENNTLKRVKRPGNDLTECTTPTKKRRDDDGDDDVICMD